jgi:hypothetical protein
LIVVSREIFVPFLLLHEGKGIRLEAVERGVGMSQFKIHGKVSSRGEIELRTQADKATAASHKVRLALRMRVSEWHVLGG